MPRLAALLLLAILLPAAAADARSASRPPRLAKLSCVPVKAERCANGPVVPRGLQVLLSGSGFYNGMRVTFRWSKGAVATTLRRTHIGWAARVPASTRAGTVWVYVRDRHYRRSKSRRLAVVEARSAPPVVAPPATGAVPAPFQGGGMWIWELGKSEGGSAAAIAQRARAAGMSTVLIKSADGTTPWSQFSASLVTALHAEGLRVCGWQYLYGTYPVTEARAAAVAAQNGADCFVLDPESEYQGRYGAAQRYVNELRALVGEAFPVAVASFPYVDYHPNLPYSVFLGPGAAQVNAPQTYWKTIGGGVDAVSAHTFSSNRIYGAPIAPLGQSYDAPKASEILRFRAIWASYGAPGITWWSWQSTAAATWGSLGGPLAGEPVNDPGWPLLARKAKGDQVIWLQQHLASEDASVTVDGMFGDETDAALRAFQAARALPVTGTTDPATWAAVLTLPVRAVDWTIAGPASARTATRTAHPSEIPPTGRGT
ncbi:MAG: Peptidoglycan-binding domain 1 protein [Solirubrobacterales bacterium]|nr:Peptidoglycan-binding domain 1 protein [Solirubrobacterales bacterium]